MNNKEEIKFIQKRFYTHIFIMVITLGFLVAIFPHEIEAEHKHPFYIYAIIGFFITLLSFLKDLIKAKKLRENIRIEEKERKKTT